MSIKKTYGGKSSRKGYLPGYRNMTIPNPMAYLQVKEVYYTTFTPPKKDFDHNIDRYEFADTYHKKLFDTKNYRVSYTSDEKQSLHCLDLASRCFHQDDKFATNYFIEEGLKANPWSVELHFLQAQLLESEGKVFEALSEFRLARSLKKWLAIPYTNRCFFPDPLGQNHRVKWLFIANSDCTSQSNNGIVLSVLRKFTAVACFIGFTTLMGNASGIGNENNQKRVEQILWVSNAPLQSDKTAECNITINRPDGTPATGIIQITGQDTVINDNDFTSPKTYILKDITGVGLPEYNSANMMIYPNPSLDGNINIALPPSWYLNGKVCAYNITGSCLGCFNIINKTFLNSNISPGLVLFTYDNGKIRQSVKLLSYSNSLRFGFTTSPATGVAQNNKIRLAGYADVDYTMTFTDPTGNIEGYTESFTATTGNTYSITQTPNWTEKAMQYSMNSNKNTKITLKNTSGQIIDELFSSTGSLQTQSITQRFNNELGFGLEYELTGEYTDTAKFLKTQFANEEFVIDTLRKGWFYITVNGNGTSYTLQTGSEVIATALVGEQSFFKRKGDQVPLDIIVQKEGYQTKTVHIDADKGLTSETINLDPTLYNHNINGSALSSITGKIIKDGTEIYIVKAEGDTAKVTVLNGLFSYSWNDLSQITGVKIGSKNIPGHTTNEISANIDDDENASITFTGLIYGLTKPVQIQNQYAENISGASISGGDAAVLTDLNGRAVISKSNISTDINNVVFSNYVLGITITKSNIQTSNQNINATEGTNAESLLNVLQEYEQWLFGTNTSPDGSLVQVWKNGSAVQSATVSGNAYETNHIKRTTKTFIADSITITKANYTRFSEANFTLTEGGNQKDATLAQLPLAVHDFYIILKDINGDKVTDLTQNLQWADGTITHATPDSNGLIHVQRTEYANPSSKVRISNNSAKYSDFMVFRKLDHNLADTNYCQIQKFDGIVNFADIPLTSIPDTLIEYTSKEKVKTPEYVVSTYGDSIDITAPVIRDMMGGYLSGQTTKFISRPGAEKVFVFQMTFNETNGTPIDQANLDKAKTELDKVLAIYTLNNGTKLLDYEFSLINSYTDPKWLESVARDNDNKARTTFYTGSPYNGNSLTSTFSTNGKYRIKNSNSKYNTGNSSGVIFAEIYQQFTNNKDPPSGSTSQWTVSSSGNATDFAKTMVRLIYLLNQGTPTE